MEIKHDGLAEVAIDSLEHYGFLVETIIKMNENGDMYQLNIISSKYNPDFKDYVCEHDLMGYSTAIGTMIFNIETLNKHKEKLINE